MRTRTRTWMYAGDITRQVQRAKCGVAFESPREVLSGLDAKMVVAELQLGENCVVLHEPREKDACAQCSAHTPRVSVHNAIQSLGLTVV